MGLPAAIGSAVAGPIGGWVGNKLFGKKKPATGPMTQEIKREDPLGDFIRNYTPQINATTQRGQTERAGLLDGWGDLRDRPGYKSQFDPSGMQRDVNSLRGFGLQGGHKTFGEFAETGGWDDKRKGDYRARIASETPAFYKSLRDDLSRGQRTRGAYSPGFVASDAKLARESARASGDAIREGELGMAGDIDRNRLAGAQGYSQNFLSGLNAAYGGERDIQNIWNQEHRYEDESGFRNQSTGLSGLQSLFGSTHGESTQQINQLLAALGMQHDWATDDRDFRYGEKKDNRTFWTNLLTQLAGGAAGAMAGRGEPK